MEGGQHAQQSMVHQQDVAVIRVGEEDVEVDLTACAHQAAFFAAIQQKRSAASSTSGPRGAPAEADLQLPDFPGGASLFKDVVRYLQVTAAEERAAAVTAGEFGVPAGVLKVDLDAFHLNLDADNVQDCIEAAALLRSPRLLRDAVLAPAAKELTSRRVLTLLERVVQVTADATSNSLPLLGKNNQADGVLYTEDADFDEDVVQAFCSVIQRLCARLDAVDFELTAPLAAGSPWASLEVLKAYRVKTESVGRVNYAFQSVTSTVKAFFYEEEKPTKPAQPQRQVWKEHHFALHVFRKHIIEATLFSRSSNLRASAELVMLEQENGLSLGEGDDDLPEVKDLETDHDIPEAICDGVAESTLRRLCGFVAYCDPLLTPPVLAAAMIRSLLIVDQTIRACALFEAVFVRSRKAQAMVVTGDIPIDFLCSVKAHRVSSTVLRRLLGRYTSLSRSELCHLLNHVTLEEFASEPHYHELILNSVLIRDLVVHCRVSTRSAIGMGKDLSVDGVDCLKLRQVGEKLFSAAFVVHNGFLPAKGPLDVHSSLVDPCAPSGSLVIDCPWDSGSLDLPLLSHVPQNEDALHLAQRVLLRGLLRRQRRAESDIPNVVRLWELGCWPRCRDAALIGEAFKFLSTLWATLVLQRTAASGSNGGAVCDRVTDEEALFKMFQDLEFWRLPPLVLLTPWVPPQLLACHIANRCKLLVQQQSEISKGNRANLEEINRLRQTVSQLSAKLEAVAARSVQSTQRQTEVSETLRSMR